jgi:hypothetical protein
MNHFNYIYISNTTKDICTQKKKNTKDIQMGGI